MTWLGFFVLALVLYVVAEVFTIGFLVPIAVIAAIIGAVLLLVDLFGRRGSRL